ncbi:hypothetical protein ACFL01_04855, partial [Planctomycetota bacterium]
ENKSVIKFPSIDTWKEACSIDLPKRKKHMHDAGPIMVLDRTAEPPAIWIANIGRQEPEDMLWKIVDRGKSLERVEHAVRRYNRHQMVMAPKIAADHENNRLFAVGGGLPAPVSIDPDTGKEISIELKGEIGKAALEQVGDIAAGPEGMLYLRSGKTIPKNERLWYVRRFNKDGELVPFEKAGEFIETHGKKEITSWGLLAPPFCVDRRGNVYVVGLISRETLRCRLDVYGPDGAMKKKGLMKMSHTGGCVGVDAAGRLYVAETLRPRARRYPDFYPGDPNNYFRKWYGVLLRMNPDGGAIEPAAGLHNEYVGRYNRPVKVTGAQWGYYGISPMPQQAGCQCRMAYFDVDEWGRVWMPDEAGYCITVLDSSGKVVTRFGAYGNWDSRGAGSAMPEPPIPLWGPGRVAVLDDHAFVADTHNRRIVQVAVGGQAREEVPVPE